MNHPKIWFLTWFFSINSPPYISALNDIVLLYVPPVCMYKHSLLLLWKSFLKGLLWRPSLLHRVATTTALSCHWGGGVVGQGWFTHHLKAEAEEEITWPEQNNDVNALRGEINIRQDWMSHKGLCTVWILTAGHGLLVSWGLHWLFTGEFLFAVERDRERKQMIEIWTIYTHKEKWHW